ncbi:MAG: hypothetical protein ACI4VN_05430 [Clostridia bacterium]
MNIGIDIDDTISNTYETVIPYAQKYTIEELGRSGTLNKEKELTTHKYTKYLHNWSDEEENIFWEKYYAKILKEVSAKTLACESIEKLSEKNKIYLITARWENEKKEIQQITKAWLEKNKIFYDELILDAENKVEVAKKYNIDIFIDDSFKNCKLLSDSGIKTFIMDSKINEKYNDEKITRVYSWPHVCQEISKVTRGDI